MHGVVAQGGGGKDGSKSKTLNSPKTATRPSRTLRPVSVALLHCTWNGVIHCMHLEQDLPPLTLACFSTMMRTSCALATNRRTRMCTCIFYLHSARHPWPDEERVNTCLTTTFFNSRALPCHIAPIGFALLGRSADRAFWTLRASTSTPTVVTTSCGTTLAVGRAEGCNGPGHARCVEGRAGERVEDAHLRTPCACTTTLRHCDRKGRVARAEAVRNGRRAWALWNDRSDVLLACSGHRLRGRTFSSRRQEDLSVVERDPDLKGFRRALRLHVPCSATWKVLTRRWLAKPSLKTILSGKGTKDLHGKAIAKHLACLCCPRASAQSQRTHCELQITLVLPPRLHRQLRVVQCHHVAKKSNT